MKVSGKFIDQYWEAHREFSQLLFLTDDPILLGMLRSIQTSINAITERVKEIDRENGRV